MTHDCRILYGSIAAMLLLLVVFGQQGQASTKPELRVAISIDIPPYVMDEANSGLEVDIVRQALKDYNLHFFQVPYVELQTVVPQAKADVSVGVQLEDDAVHYSVDFITFANYAISKKADGLRIDSVADLQDHQVLTWGNAYLELGPEFEAMFSPQSPQRKNYIEVADQMEQVRKFWGGQGRIIVIDQSIFIYFSRELGHDLSEVSFHAIFPPVTNFKAGFKDVTVRNRFIEGLAAMCRNGAYAELLKRYGVVAEQALCE